MTTIRPATIVAGVNETPEALDAAQFAADEAQLRRQPLTLLFAYGDPPRYVRDDARLVLDDIVDQIDVAPRVHVDLRIAEGDAIRTLSAASGEASLMVVGRRHGAWGERVLSSSVSSALSSKASCPVVTVPERWDPASAGRGPVVVAIDAETSAHGSLSFAFARADLAGVPLVVLHAVPPASGPREQTRRELDVAEVLAGWNEQFPGVEVVTRFLQDTADEAALHASTHASMLVVGRPHEYAGPGSWVGSVGRAVLRHTVSPLAVVPRDPADERRTPPDPARDLVVPTY
jgi:nucleotide-binding universal stress UspA family protein